VQRPILRTAASRTLQMPPVRIAWLSQDGGPQVCFTRGTVSRIQDLNVLRKSRFLVTDVAPSAFLACGNWAMNLIQCLDAEIPLCRVAAMFRRRPRGNGVKVRGIADARLSDGDRNARPWKMVPRAPYLVSSATAG
jgi:hypothetical protein